MSCIIGVEDYNKTHPSKIGQTRGVGVLGKDCVDAEAEE